jgi:hypothetical protein
VRFSYDDTRGQRVVFERAREKTRDGETDPRAIRERFRFFDDAENARSRRTKRICASIGEPRRPRGACAWKLSSRSANGERDRGGRTTYHARLKLLVELLDPGLGARGSRADGLACVPAGLDGALQLLDASLLHVARLLQLRHRLVQVAAVGLGQPRLIWLRDLLDGRARVLADLGLGGRAVRLGGFRVRGGGLDDRLRGGSRGVRGGHGDESVPVTIREIARERRRCEVKRPRVLVRSGGDGWESVVCVRGGGDGARAQLSRERRTRSLWTTTRSKRADSLPSTICDRDIFLVEKEPLPFVA